MNNEMINKPPFKVKCIESSYPYLTVGKEYDVVEILQGFYKVKMMVVEHNGIATVDFKS